MAFVWLFLTWLIRQSLFSKVCCWGCWIVGSLWWCGLKGIIICEREGLLVLGHEMGRCGVQLPCEGRVNIELIKVEMAIVKLSLSRWCCFVVESVWNRSKIAYRVGNKGGRSQESLVRVHSFFPAKAVKISTSSFNPHKSLVEAKQSKLTK